MNDPLRDDRFDAAMRARYHAAADAYQAALQQPDDVAASRARLRVGELQPALDR